MDSQTAQGGVRACRALVKVLRSLFGRDAEFADLPVRYDIMRVIRVEEKFRAL